MARAAEIDIVRREDGTHQIAAYDDDTGRGRTRCSRDIWPWEAWLVGRVTCPECREASRPAGALGPVPESAKGDL